jgi:hypothetical protein
MHLYLRLVNDSGDPLVEQVLEEGFHLVEVGSESCGVSGITDNPTPQASPGAYNHFLVLYKYYAPKSYPLCIKYNRIWVITNCCMPALMFLYHLLIPFCKIG